MCASSDEVMKKLKARRQEYIPVMPEFAGLSEEYGKSTESSRLLFHLRYYRRRKKIWRFRLPLSPLVHPVFQLRAHHDVCKNLAKRMSVNTKPMPVNAYQSLQPIPYSFWLRCTVSSRQPIPLALDSAFRWDQRQC